MPELLKHGRFRYCDKEDCKHFSKCGLALTNKIYVDALVKDLEVKTLEHCVYYYVNLTPGGIEND